MMEDKDPLGDPEPPGDGTTNVAPVGDPEPPGDSSVAAYSDTGATADSPEGIGDPEPPGDTNEPNPTDTV
jgi:hypothetical protein